MMKLGTRIVVEFFKPSKEWYSTESVEITSITPIEQEAFQLSVYRHTRGEGRHEFYAVCTDTGAGKLLTPMMFRLV